MTTEKTLAEAFSALESNAPDADVEYAVLTGRLHEHPRRPARRLVVGAVAATGIAATVACIVSLVPGDPTAHPQRGAAARPDSSTRAVGRTAVSMPKVQQVAFSKDLDTTTEPDGIERPVVTVDAGWLPAGASMTSASADSIRGEVGSERRWLVPYPRNGLGGYYVSVQHDSGHVLPRGEYISTTFRALTVGGHPARLFDVRWGRAVHQVIVAVDYGQGRIYESGVFYETQKLSSTTAVAVAEHVAREMKVERRDPLPVTARLTAAPKGAEIVDAYAVFDDTVYNDHFTMTSYRLDDEDTGAQIGIGGLAEKYPAPIKGTAGRRVQGRPTVVITSKGRTILYIKGLFGKYTKIISGKGAETLADLYQLADGIRAVR